MPNFENFPEFDFQHFQEPHPDRFVERGQVNVFRLEEALARARPVHYSRRHYYKITLLNRGHNLYHYADKSLEANGPALLFFNPQVPYSCQALSDQVRGFYCLFPKEFLRRQGGPDLLEQSLFKPGGHPIYLLTAGQDAEVSALFEKMLIEINSGYFLKYDLLRHHTAELIHYALKLQPAGSLYQQPDAKARLTGLFLELLERQFPIGSPNHRFTLRLAGDFARQLAVHVNYLNQCVRETTGKTTSAHIAGRLVSEARALLRHTDWNVA